MFEEEFRQQKIYCDEQSYYMNGSARKGTQGSDKFVHRQPDKNGLIMNHSNCKSKDLRRLQAIRRSLIARCISLLSMGRNRTK